MQVAVLCSQMQRQELGPVSESVIFLDHPGMLAASPAQVVLDLQFEDRAAQRLSLLQNGNAGVVIVNDVLGAIPLPPHFIRINAWPNFLAGPLAEVCGGTEAARQQAAEALGLLYKKAEWVPNVPGMIAPRIIAAIINEAYFALSEGIASKEAINTAMKLGTAYPYGPFEWVQKIGASRIAHLLQALSTTEPRYQPCPLLMQEKD